MTYTPIADEPDSDDYRRCARRLRAIHADRPERLQPALSELAHAMDARRGCAEPADVAKRLDSTAALFAEQVSSRVTGDTLRYSDRLALLETADELQIGRFEANLIIAMVQHRIRGAALSPDAADKALESRVFDIRREVVAFVAVQSVVLLGAWFLFS